MVKEQVHVQSSAQSSTQSSAQSPAQSEQPTPALLAATEARLRGAGVKLTSQRLEIGALMLATPQHLSADQILTCLQKRGRRVSKATVYNTLKLFTERGLLREVSVDPARQFYDSTTHPHHHFFNVDSGELVDIDAETLQIIGLPELPPGTEAAGVEVIVRVRNAG